MADRPKWHVAHLDALRGLAILAVVAVHAASEIPLPPLLGQIAFSGQRGVQLFFIVSAFTLTLSHENRRSAEARPLANFFLRRFFRLAPVYYLDILCTAVFLPAIAGSWRDRLLGVLFLQGLSVSAITHVALGTWSIADEAFFYLCLPLLLRLIRSLRSALLWFAVLTPAALLLSIVLVHRHRADGQFYTFFWFPIELPVFLMGILVYYFWKERIAARSLPEPRRKRLSLLCLLGCAVLYPFTLPVDNHKLYLGSAACALLVLGLSIYPWRLFVNRFTVFMGRISFSVYLLHFWAVTLVLRLTGPLLGHLPPLALYALRFTAILLPTAGVATLTWRFLEEAGIGLGRRVIARLEGSPGSAASTVSPATLSPARPSGRDEQF